MRGFRDDDTGNAAFDEAAENVRDAVLCVVLGKLSPTGKAVFCEAGVKRLWVPCVLLRRRVDNSDGTSTITVPAWFARKEGLL